MTTWARINNGVVVELTAIDPTNRFHTNLVWAAVPTGVTPIQGWSYAAGTFSAPPALMAAPTLPQQAATAINAGLSISSTTTPALNGTYPASATAQAQINAEVTSILLNGTFADGTSTIEWLDVTGTAHSFTVAQFKTLATAIGVFVSGCFKCINGQSTTIPSSIRNIP